MTAQPPYSPEALARIAALPDVEVRLTGLFGAVLYGYCPPDLDPQDPELYADPDDLYEAARDREDED